MFMGSNTIRKIISKLDAINAVKGGPKITQHANPVEKSIIESIKSLYLLDKLFQWR